MVTFTSSRSSKHLEEIAKTVNQPFWRRRRYFLVFMAFLGLFNIYALRVNLSVAVVAMTEKREVLNENGIQVLERHFDWNSKEKGLISSSFFYGYLLTQIVGGVLAKKIGGKLMFGVGIGFSAILNMLTPMAAKWSLYALVGVRITEGLFQGVTYSSLFEMWSKWCPPLERSRMITIASSGNYVGIVLTLPISGIIATSLSWEYVFYVFGITGCIFAMFWLLFVHESPATDPWISEEEKLYIQNSLIKEVKNTPLEIPWKAIWTSKAVWAIIAAQFAERWGFFTLQTQLPQFLKDVMNFDVTKLGLVAAAPYIAMSVMLQVAGFLADWVQIKGYLTTKHTRQYFNCIAFVAQTICMLSAAYFLHPTISILFIALGVSFAAFSYASFSVNYLDIAPQFAGILMGICNSFAVVAGIMSPLLTGFIVTTPSEHEWKTVLYITSGIYLFGCVVYWFWCEGTVQPWAIQSPEPQDISKEPPSYIYIIQSLDVKDEKC